MPLPDPADVLLAKARQDVHLASRVVEDATVCDEHIGFFCQQAVEKSIKSVLARRGVGYRRTHDLAELLDLLTDNGLAFRAELERSVALTPFAVEMRYDVLPPEQEHQPLFDRQDALRVARLAVDWASTKDPG